MAAIAVVIELVAQDELVVVPVAIERANRVGIVGPTFVARDMALHRPGLATVERLVEPKQVVVTLWADEPFAGADQVIRVGRVDADIRLRVILDQHRRPGGIPRVAGGLRQIWAELLARRRGSAAG